ncbi:MAG: YncE family protein, partial [Anaerolineae bacterium]
MFYKRPVLRLLILGLLFVLILAACADGTPQTLPSATPTAAGPAHILPPASPPATSPPSDPTPAPAAPGEGSPWPAFLRALNFGVAAGNSYGPRALALHPDLGRAYIRTHAWPTYDDSVGLVTVLDVASGEVLAVVETGLDRYAEGELHLDTHHGRLYAVNVDEATCTILDTKTFENLSTLDGVERVALDTEAGHLYIAGLGGLRVLDAQDYALIIEVPVRDASRFLALALDAPGERVYALYEAGGQRVLSLHDLGTLEMQSSHTLPGRPHSLVADTHLHRAYLTLDDGQDNLLWVVDRDGKVLAERRLGGWTQHTTLALDADQGYLF